MKESIQNANITKNEGKHSECQYNLSMISELKVIELLNYA